MAKVIWEATATSILLEYIEDAQHEFGNTSEQKHHIQTLPSHASAL